MIHTFAGLYGGMSTHLCGAPGGNGWRGPHTFAGLYGGMITHLCGAVWENGWRGLQSVGTLPAALWAASAPGAAAAGL